jgi:hypothetical protein
VAFFYLKNFIIILLTENSNTQICPNCENILRSKDKYCPICGQKKLDEHDFSVKHFLIESFGDFFHFESKLINSIKPVLFKPGFLTLEYMKGRRNKYFQPFKMFLFISVFFFILSSFNLSRFHRSDDNGKEVKNKPIITFTIDSTTSSTDSIRKLPIDSLRNLINNYGVEKLMGENGSWFERYMFKLAMKMRISGEEKVIEELYHYISKLIFLLIPLFALLLKLLYIRRKKTYYEHLVFSLHFHSFVFLLYILAEIASVVTFAPQSFIPIFLLVYLFFALKKVYTQKTGKTLLKTILLLFSYSVIVGIFFFLTTVFTLEML